MVLGVTDPGLAVRLHVIVGGTPAYRLHRSSVTMPRPTRVISTTGWCAGLNPDRPLLREARYLLAEETDIRDPALYHSVLAASPRGTRRGAGSLTTSAARRPTSRIRSTCSRTPVSWSRRVTLSGRAGSAIASPSRSSRSTRRSMRPRWADLELGLGAEVWADARPTFGSQVAGPHFEALRRKFARVEGRQASGRPTGKSRRAPWPIRRTGRRSRSTRRSGSEPHRGEPRSIISLGEAKWGKVMGIRHIERLRRARALLTIKGYDTTDTTAGVLLRRGFRSRPPGRQRQRRAPSRCRPALRAGPRARNLALPDPRGRGYLLWRRCAGNRSGRRSTRPGRRTWPCGCRPGSNR